MPEVLKRVGRFDLLEVIGRGGAAVVYLAVQRDLQRNVALKELAPFHLADSSFAERFVEESRLTGAMNHANVVTVHEYFEDGSVPYIAMEYLPHGSLRQYIGRLNTAQIAGVLEGVLAGLAHGEAHQIVHRDLKPENLLVAIDGRVKIADFGVARAYSQAATRAVVTVAGTTIGTPAYMSPEQALGNDMTPATDLYSLGIVAWEMLTGQVPFEETDTPVAVLYRHVHEEIPSVRSVAPDVDEGIAAWLERMLAKRPEDRFQGADEAWVALEDVVLDLLGPRWRRESRLPVEKAGAPGGRTPTPAAFPTPGAVPATITGEPVSDPTGDAAPLAPVPAGPTRAPARRRRSNTTMLRQARRHHDELDATGAPGPDATRRRLLAGAIITLMAIAAVIGVIVAQPGPARRTGQSAAQRAAAQARVQAAEKQVTTTMNANRQILRIAQGLATTRVRALTGASNASTPAAQIRDVSADRTAYETAAAKVAKLSGQTTSAHAIAATMRTVAGDLGTVVAAGRAGNQARWTRGLRRAATDETRLKSQLAPL